MSVVCAFRPKTGVDGLCSLMGQGELFWVSTLGMPVFSPKSRGGRTKDKSSAKGGLERASESPSGDPTRDLAAPAMAIGSNPFSSTTHPGGREGMEAKAACVL